MKNKLSDLTNHLFESLERLNDDDVKGDELREEISRARAISAVASQIVQTGRLVLDGQKHIDEYGKNTRGLPELFSPKESN